MSDDSVTEMSHDEAEESDSRPWPMTSCTRRLSCPSRPCDDGSRLPTPRPDEGSLRRRFATRARRPPEKSETLRCVVPGPFRDESFDFRLKVYQSGCGRLNCR